MSNVPPPPPPGGTSGWEPPTPPPAPTPGDGALPPPPPPATNPPSGSPPVTNPPAGSPTVGQASYLPPAGEPSYLPPTAGAAFGGGPPTGPLGAPPKQTNGLAIAALVLGILSVTCLGPIAGIAAIILGVVGMNKAKVVGTGKGLSIAGLVLGILGTLAGIVLLALVIWGGSNADDLGLAGRADPSDYALTLDADTCLNDGGLITFSGTIGNRTTSPKNFIVNTEITNTATGALFTQMPTFVTDVPPGGSTTWEVVTVADVGVRATCEVTGVDNFLNFD